MKFITAVVLTALLSFVLCLYTPWWWMIAIAAFVVAVLVPQQHGRSFLAGFTALFFLWGLLAFFISSKNGHLLAHKMSLIIIKNDNPFLLVAVTALVGSLVAGLAALSGSYVRPPRKGTV